MIRNVIVPASLLMVALGCQEKSLGQSVATQSEDSMGALLTFLPKDSSNCFNGVQAKNIENEGKGIGFLSALKWVSNVSDLTAANEAHTVCAFYIAEALVKITADKNGIRKAARETTISYVVLLPRRAGSSRLSAISLLGEVQTVEDLPVLARYLKDITTAQTAAKAIGKSLDLEAVKVLSDAAARSDTQHRFAVLAALGSLSTDAQKAEAKIALEDFLENVKHDAFENYTAREALDRLSNEE